MGYVEDMQLLSKYGLDTAKTLRFSIGTKSDAIKKVFSYPFVVKVEGASQLHKTDIGGVKIVENDDDLEDFLLKAKELKRRFNLKSIIAQEFVKGTELFIGAKKDQQFGPIVLFGLGGIFVEVIGKPTIRLAPLTKKDAEKMIEEMTGREIIRGARGREPVNEKKLVNSLLGVSKMITEMSRIKEIDVNPLIGNSKYVKAVDVRIIR